MGADQLLSLFEGPDAAFDAWYQLQIASAYVSLAFVFKKSGNTHLLDPDLPESVVNIAVENVMSRLSGYIWDGRSDFNFFFKKMIFRVVNRIHAETRQTATRSFEPLNENIHNSIKLSQNAVQDYAWKIEKYNRHVAGIFAASKIRPGSATHKYMHRLPLYAAEKWTQAEISADLGIQEESIPALRLRVKARFEDDPEQS